MDEKEGPWQTGESSVLPFKIKTSEDMFTLI